MNYPVDAFTVIKRLLVFGGGALPKTNQIRPDCSSGRMKNN
jgi:hypothetical protein